MAILCRFEIRYCKVQDEKSATIGDARGEAFVTIANPEKPYEPQRRKKLYVQSGDWQDVGHVAVETLDYNIKAVLGFGGTIDKDRYTIRFLSASETITETKATFVFYVEAQD